MKFIASGILACSLACLPLTAAQKEKEATATSDQAFVDLAAQTDMTEAHLGQLAQENASSQAVKDYANMLVTDHTADYTKLTAVATKAGLTVPKGLDAKQDKMIAPFEKLKGKAFDTRYVRTMVLGHEGAIAAYNKESRDGQNADLKAYATEALPTLEKHESGAKDLEKKKAS
jgi:putative membrane protein